MDGAATVLAVEDWSWACIVGQYLAFSAAKGGTHSILHLKTAQEHITT